jgi:predicted RecB family nuclease
MILSSGDIYRLHRPSTCELRLYLHHQGVEATEPGPYEKVIRRLGERYERAGQGWQHFLAKARSITREYGDIPFVHWHHYERVKLDIYAERYGDPDGTAARLRGHLVDLLPVTQKAVALPLPSYSLKVVEQYVGFRRSQSEYGGDGRWLATSKRAFF